MKLILGISLLAISCLAHAQDRKGSELQLHTRQGPPLQPPDEQLLPLSSVPPFVVPDPKKYPQKYAAVYMPVSLAVGRVRNPGVSGRERAVVRHRASSRGAPSAQVSSASVGAAPAVYDWSYSRAAR